MANIGIGSSSSVNLWNNPLSDASIDTHIPALKNRGVSVAYGHTAAVFSVVFSPDGSTLASGGSDRTVRLWNATTGELLETFMGHTNWVHSVSYSPDGRTLASGSHDKTFRFWQVSQEAAPAVAAAPISVQPRPSETGLLPNYPNPFNPETWIPYRLATPANVTLRIYGVNGELVRTLALGHQVAGGYTSRGRAAYWDGRNEIGERVASGIYFYTFTAGDFMATRRMLILK